MAIKNVLKGEFIGMSMKITSSPNPILIGLEGEIIDETKNTFVIETNNGRKTILKNQITFTIKKGDDLIQIQGEKLCFRPEDRVKKIR